MKVLRMSLLVLMVLALMASICHGQSAKDCYDKGIDYGLAGEFEKAQQEFKKALEGDPLYMPAETCLKLTEDALEETIKVETALYLFKGIDYGNKEMFDKAITEYKKAVKINPKYALAHCSLGAAYLNKGTYSKAITELKKAIEINPEYAEAHNNLAIAYYERKKYNLAIDHCDRATELGYRVGPKLSEDLMGHPMSAGRKVVKTSKPRLPGTAPLVKQGLVVVKAWVLPNGKVRNVKVLDSCGSLSVDRSFTQAVTRWRFEPIEEQKIEYTILPFPFTMKKTR